MPNNRSLNQQRLYDISEVVDVKIMDEADSDDPLEKAICDKDLTGVTDRQLNILLTFCKPNLISADVSEPDSI